MKDYTALVRQLDSALQQVKGGQLLSREAPRPLPDPNYLLNAAVSRDVLPSVIELPRYCAIYDGELWLARYGLEGNSYKFRTSIELTPQQRHRYSAQNAITLPRTFRSDVERCACCGAWTRDGFLGAVECLQHSQGRGARVCYGNTSPGGFFRCTPSCGTSSQLIRAAGPERFGVVPGR
jgi:hypothetical protein